ncbi:MAG: NADP-dependent oxidoreductase [Austwickia sp.]|nr:MAG: NADP-dependent oxidoreductase [Austwickia sp.]
MSTPTSSRQIVLAERPTGWPTQDTFRTESVDLPDLAPDQVLVRNLVMSVDPYMRGRMNDVKSYIPPFQIDAPLDGGAVGEVIASTSDALPVGSTVLHGLGWREHAIVPASSATAVDVDVAPASAYLGVLGMPGLTAYAGLLAAGEFQPGDAVFASGAAGAVGSLVGQIAKLKGASRVVGSAGSPAKVARLLDLGFDAAFDYHDGPVVDRLREASPDGIDVYFDNVGGDHLEAALTRLNVDGRVAMCGAIAQYNDATPRAAPRNLALAIGKRLTLRGFVVAKYAGMRGEFVADMSGWLAGGQIRYDETFRDGLDAAPTAFLEMMRGANRGKMLVRL